MSHSLFDITPTLSVSQLTHRIKELVEEDGVLGDVWVCGEISNLTQAASGHVYFTLKDPSAAIRCVMWKARAARLFKLPVSGDAVQVHGAVSMYEARGDVQLYVDELKAAGTGALWQQFERLRTRLLEEGLFAPEHKRPLPKFPHTVGVVTSREGAVLYDICNVLRRRYPLVEVLLAPTLVQGDGAAEMIAAAIGTINRFEIDLLIVARGGGSLEDLWAFNAECVARAIYASRVPVISAVGHETDFTIADFVADVRAPTPSAAAEIAVADARELQAALRVSEQRLVQLIRDDIGDARVQLSNKVHALRRNSPQARIASDRQRVDELSRRTEAGLGRSLALRREVLNGALRQLTALNPQATLARGYAVVRDKANGRVVKSTTEAKPGKELQVRVADGEFDATVDGGRG